MTIHGIAVTVLKPSEEISSKDLVVLFLSNMESGHMGSGP